MNTKGGVATAFFFYTFDDLTFQIYVHMWCLCMDKNSKGIEPSFKKNNVCSVVYCM